MFIFQSVKIGVKIVEASHPIPDTNGIEDTSEILRLLSNTSEKNLIICLISGGGSAGCCVYSIIIHEPK